MLLHLTFILEDQGNLLIGQIVRGGKGMKNHKLLEFISMVF